MLSSAALAELTCTLARRDQGPRTPEAAQPGHAAGKSLNRSEPFWLDSSLPLRGQARFYKVFINLSAGPAPLTVGHLWHPAPGTSRI